MKVKKFSWSPIEFQNHVDEDNANRLLKGSTHVETYTRQEGTYGKDKTIIVFAFYPDEEREVVGIELEEHNRKVKEKLKEININNLLSRNPTLVEYVNLLQEKLNLLGSVGKLVRKLKEYGCKTVFSDGVNIQRFEEETKINAQKPPLGVIPRKLWIEERIGQLSRAIREYIEYGACDQPIIEWNNELVELHREQEKLTK